MAGGDFMAKIAWKDIEKAAKTLGLEPCALSAVCQVEADGDGFLPDGRPKILFEGHVFWKELKKVGIAPEQYAASNANILYPKWTKAHYQGGAKEYDRLNRAKRIHEDAALKSASWGAFQIMGFNYAVCGCGSVQEFVEAMHGGYAGQLEMLGGFLKANNLIRHLNSRNWAAFARGYNGSGYTVNSYDVNLRQAYEKCVISK